MISINITVLRKEKQMKINRSVMIIFALTLAILLGSGVTLAEDIPTLSAANEKGTVTSTEEKPDVDLNSPADERVVVVYHEGGDIADLGLNRDTVEAASSVSDDVDLIQPKDGASAEALAAAIDRNDKVEAAFVDADIPVMGLPNDKELSYTSGSSRADAVYTQTKAVNTWDQITGNDTVKVAVIDTGCQTQHEDLTGKTEAVKDYFSTSKEYPKYNAYPGEDLAYHGTRVCGIIGATANNGVGIAGVTGTANVKIVPYRAGGTYNGDADLRLFAIVAALNDIAKDDSIRVVNMSFGIVENAVTQNSIDTMSYYVKKNVNAGKVMVAAAGNHGATSSALCYPAACEGVIGVGALSCNFSNGSSTPTIDKYSSSAANASVDVTAPGQYVRSTYMYSSTFGTSTYDSVSGTSFSTPIVAGEAAMLLAAAPDLSAAQVEQIIESTAKDLGAAGRDDAFGYGIVQFDKALARVKKDPVDPNADLYRVSPQKAAYTGRAVNVTVDKADAAAGDVTNITITDASGKIVSAPVDIGTYTVRVDTAANQTYNAATGLVVGTLTISNPSEFVPSVYYRTHVENIGWQPYVRDAEMAGTTGLSYRLEAMTVKLDNSGLSGNIEYRTHVQNIGWEQNWKTNDAISGTNGKGYRLEAMQVRLTGELADYYDVYYRVHAQNFGWLSWAKNGEESGTAGFGYRLEGMQIVLVKKGETPPSLNPAANDDRAYIIQGEQNIHPDNRVAYRTHVENIGWQSYMVDGQSAGTSGLGYRLEGMNIKLNRPAYDGSVEYRTHIQNIGWETQWKKDGEMSGTDGKGYRLEAMQVRLTGEMAERYDVYYRVHAQNFGWLNWAKNGEQAGTEGFGYRLEAMQLVLVPKGQGLSTFNPACDRNEAFIKKTKDIAISMARAQGYDQIYEGTLRFCTTASSVNEIFPQNLTFGYPLPYRLPYAVLCLDKAENILATVHANGRPLFTHSSDHVNLANNVGSWQGYHGKRIVVGFRSVNADWPSQANVLWETCSAHDATLIWKD